jgi:hypothetical protein
LNVIAVMSEFAGSFMRTRIESLWPELLSLHKKLCGEVNAVSGKATQQKQQTKQLTMTKTTEIGYLDTTTKTLIHSLQNLLLTIVKFVEVDADKFDDVLRMLGPMGNLEEEKKTILKEFNGDAVWLAEYRDGDMPLKMPSSARFAFAKA